MTPKKASAGKRIVVALSGSGRSLENLYADAAKDDAYEIVGVISSSKNCRGYELAKEFGVALFYDPFKTPFSSELTLQVRTWLQSCHPDMIVLAGFLRPFPLFDEYKGRVINIHPALLPEFGGKGMYGHHVHDAVIKSGALESGATVHFVNERYDEGRIIAQAKVPVLPGDSSDDLAARVFAAEKKLYPFVLRGLLNGTLPLAPNDIKIYKD